MIFFIPFLPISVNAIYEINHRQRRVFLSTDAKSFKSRAKMYMPLPDKGLTSKTKVELLIIIYRDMYFKNGNMRKYDLQNLEKILIDAISEKYGHDDSYVWKKVSKKSHEINWSGVGVCVRKLGEG